MTAERLTLSLPSELHPSPVDLHRVRREGKGDIDVAVAHGEAGEDDRAIIVPLASGARLDPQGIEVARVGAIASAANSRVVAVGFPGYISPIETSGVGLSPEESKALLRGDFTLQAEAQLGAVEEILGEVHGQEWSFLGYSAAGATVAAMAKYLASRNGELPHGGSTRISRMTMLDVPNLLDRSLSVMSVGVMRESVHSQRYYNENNQYPHLPSINAHNEQDNSDQQRQSLSAHARFALAQNLPTTALRRGFMPDIISAMKMGKAMDLHEARVDLVRAERSVVSNKRHHALAGQLMRHMGVETHHIQLEGENHPFVHSLGRAANLASKLKMPLS